MISIQKQISFCLAAILVLASAVTVNAQQTKARTPTTKRPPATKAAPRTPRATTPKTPATPRPVAPRPEPKADDTKPEPKPAQPPVAPPPTPAPKDQPKSDTSAGTLDIGPKTETDPAVLTALELPRKNPGDYLKSVLWLIDLGRPELAKPILAELAKLQLTDAQRAELVTEFGSSSMLKLARSKELDPTGASFADACMAAVSAANNDPQRVAVLINQLTDPSAEVRFLAQHDLSAMGQKGANSTLEAFAREPDRNRRAAFAAGAATMRPLVDGPLLAMLDTRNPALRADILSLAEQLNIPQAAPFVLAGSNSAERALATALDQYRRGTPVFAPDADNRVELWQWNDATKQLSSLRVPAADARTIWMAKLARALYQLQPQNPDYQRQALVLAWESQSLDSTDRPATTVSQQAPNLDTRLLNDVLAEALKDNSPHAAVAAANALAKRGDRNVLVTYDGKPSPLAEALASPNRNVRFAALQAIMTLDPASPYPGSSRVPKALAWFAGGATAHRAIVAMPTHAAAADLAGKLSAHDFAAEPTHRGRDAVNMAHDMSDVDAIFVDMDIIVPGIRDVLYDIRTNPTTGEVPIAILAADGRLEAAKKLAAEHQRVIAVPRPHSPEVVADAVKQLADLSTNDNVSASERAAQAEQARAWLEKLESGAHPFYVIRRTAMLNPAPSRVSAPENLPKQ